MIKDVAVETIHKLGYMEDLLSLLTSREKAKKLVNPLINNIVSKTNFVPDATFGDDECVMVNLIKLMFNI